MGMGASHARRFVEEGAQVALTDIDADAGTKLAADLGKNAVFLEHDVTDPDTWAAVVARVDKAFGPVTVLVNNAGIAGVNARTADIHVKDFLLVMSVNLYGVFYGMRAVIPGMIAAGGGSIVNIASTAGFTHTLGTRNLAYTAAKFAVRGMTKAAAVEYARQNIRVNAVAPGGVLTPMVSSNLTDEARVAIAAEIPMGRLAEPGELSNVVLFMATDESSYMTGATVLSDGGLLR